MTEARPSNASALRLTRSALAALATSAVIIGAACAAPPKADIGWTEEATAEGIADCAVSYSGEEHAEERADCISAVKVRALGWPACEEEDSRGPCAWDAWSSGNGVGRSFYVTAQGFTVYP